MRGKDGGGKGHCGRSWVINGRRRTRALSNSLGEITSAARSRQTCMCHGQSAA